MDYALDWEEHALGPAIELADLDVSPTDPEAILSGNIHHRHVIFGPRDDGRAGAILGDWSGRVFRNGKVEAHVSAECLRVSA